MMALNPHLASYGEPGAFIDQKQLTLCYSDESLRSGCLVDIFVQLSLPLK